MSGTSRFVAYERVSTKRQGASGLGLEVQRKATDDLAATRDAEVLARFVEVESGKQNERPQLVKALHLAKVTGATLLIAKLDRLSRNAAFLLTLRDSGGRFVAADMPEANELTVGIMALVAEVEREATSRRTRRRWRPPRHGECVWATETAPQRSGGLAGAQRPCERPLRGTPTDRRRTCGRWSRMPALAGQPACGPLRRR